MVKQQHDTQGFRASYRQGIKNFYSGWRHLSSIVALSTLIMLYCLYNIEVLEARDWLMVPLGMVIYNLGEYASHRWVGHIKRRWARLFYQRHTGEHHSFFSELLMSYDTKKDWRLVLFPLYLTAIQGLLIAPLLGVLVALLFSSNAAYLLVFTLVASHLSYELLHLGYHQPDDHWFHRVPGFRELAFLHRLHHRRSLMTACNFNLTFPLFDLLLGTFYWEVGGTKERG